MSSYKKLDSSLLDSSLWCESTSTRLVWITMLLMSDDFGNVRASIPGIARQAGVSIIDTKTAIAKLQAIDPYAKENGFDGRRIAPTATGWTIFN